MADSDNARANQALPIVLVPGLNCSARVFGDVLPALWRHGPVAVANHLRGDSLAAIAAHILAAAPARFALVGFSLGGYLAFELRRQAPERIARLALVDTSARPDAPAQTTARREQVALTRAGRFSEVVDAFIPLQFHPSRVDDPRLRSIYRAMAEEDCGPEAFLRHVEAIMRRPDSRPDLAAIDCPTLVLVGADDRITPPEHAEEMARGIRRARLVVVPECAHMSLLDRPAPVAQALGDWLQA